MTVSEAPSHAELEAAIEQVRATCEPVVTEDGYYSDAALAINRRRETLAALLAVLTELLDLAADLDRMYVNVPQDLRATVTTALRKMGAL